MTYRLQQLAIGNYILEYTAPPHGKTELTETLLRVEARTVVDDEGEQYVLSLFGVTKGSWGAPTFASKTVDTTNDKLKFTPMSHQQALHWLADNKIPDAIAKAKASAEEAVVKANLQIDQLAVISGEAQSAIEGVVS